MPLLHLFYGPNPLAEAGQLDKFLLNGLQAFKSLGVSGLPFRTILALQAVLVVQFLNLSNLRPQTPDLFSKNLEVIHTIRIVHLP
jgi:hypothetical protein